VEEGEAWGEGILVGNNGAGRSEFIGSGSGSGYDISVLKGSAVGEGLEVSKGFGSGQDLDVGDGQVPRRRLTCRAAGSARWRGAGACIGRVGLGHLCGGGGGEGACCCAAVAIVMAKAAFVHVPYVGGARRPRGYSAATARRASAAASGNAAAEGCLPLVLTMVAARRGAALHMLCGVAAAPQ
jgi:hypothetical protein